MAAGGVGRAGCGGSRRTVIEALETYKILQCMWDDYAEFPSGQMYLFALKSSGFFKKVFFSVFYLRSNYWAAISSHRKLFT